MSKIRGPKSEIKGIKLLHKDTHKKYNDFSLQNGKLQLDHPPKFLELSPGDFFLFPELKLHNLHYQCLRGISLLGYRGATKTR